MKRNCVFQRSENDCGIACLIMALDHLEQKVDHSYLFDVCDTSNPLSLTQLIHLGAEHGLLLSPFHGSLADALEPGNIIMFKGENSAHMAFVARKLRDRFVIYDPDLGELYLDKAHLEQGYANVFLTCKMCDLPTIQPAGAKKYSFTRTSNRYAILSLLCYGVPNLFMVAGIISMVYVSSTPILATIFFIVALISVLLSRFACSFLMRRMDQLFMEGRRKDPHVSCSVIYPRYCRYKGLFYSLPSVLLSSAVGLFAATFLLPLHEPLLAIGLSIGYVLFVIFHLCSMPCIKRLRSDIAFEERFMFQKGNEAYEIDILSSLFKKSNLLSRQFIGYEVISISLSFLIVCFILIYKQEVDAFSLITYVAASYYCFQLLSRIAHFHISYEEYRREKARFAYLYQ